MKLRKVFSEAMLAYCYQRDSDLAEAIVNQSKKLIEDVIDTVPDKLLLLEDLIKAHREVGKALLYCQTGDVHRVASAFRISTRKASEDLRVFHQRLELKLAWEKERTAKEVETSAT